MPVGVVMSAHFDFPDPPEDDRLGFGAFFLIVAIICVLAIVVYGDPSTLLTVSIFGALVVASIPARPG
ncbi:MAG TPA: hypothetical protein VFB99_24370 [Vicinamibacterales bacterium]|nr:hypothetical protein [Vicinamibacterales bacterium]